jgi:bifunctional non-homologous end joining protein LigD
VAESCDHPDWIFEIKYDGFRALAYADHGTVRLVSRKGNVYKSFPALCNALAGFLQVQDAILGGEIVHLDSKGKPQFHALLRRRSPQHFVAFDLLWLDGKDLRTLQMLVRKRVLPSVVPAGSAPVLYADHVDGTGSELF